MGAARRGRGATPPARLRLARGMGERREPRRACQRLRRDRPGRSRRVAGGELVSDSYTILTLDEVETAQHRGSNLIPVRHTLGFQPAGVNAWIADAGGQLIPPHEEDSGNEELYVVVRGRASFTVGEETADAPAGSIVFVPPEVFRTAAAEDDGTIVFAVGGTVGEAFNAGGWDSFALAD